MYVYLHYYILNRMLGMTPEKEEVENPGSVDVENIELTVMDDISSPSVPLNAGKHNSSSDEEGGDSSGSEEDRYMCTCACTVCYVQLVDVQMYMYMYMYIGLLKYMYIYFRSVMSLTLEIGV